MKWINFSFIESRVRYDFLLKLERLTFLNSEFSKSFHWLLVTEFPQYFIWFLVLKVTQSVIFSFWNTKENVKYENTKIRKGNSEVFFRQYLFCQVEKFYLTILSTKIEICEFRFWINYELLLLSVSQQLRLELNTSSMFYLYPNPFSQKDILKDFNNCLCKLFKLCI